MTPSGAEVRADRRSGLCRPASLIVAVTLAVVVSAAAGCSSGGSAIQTPYGGGHAPIQHGPTYEIKAAAISGLGSVLVNGQGLTVYMFANDQRGAPSRCYDICSVQWPPLLLPAHVASPVAGPGIKPGLLGTAPRSDGTVQVTYGGWPLYVWPPDRSPGRATGQALTNAGGRWYVVDPAGDPVITP